LANQDPNWIVITLRGMGEMEDSRSLPPDPAKSWIDLSNETDRWSRRRAYVNLVATNNDYNLWAKMDHAAFDFATELFNAKSLSDVVELSTAHLRKQVEAMTAQTKELTSLAQKVATETAEPIKEGVGKVFKQAA